MLCSLTAIVVLAVALSAPLCSQSFPHAEIENSPIKAELYLPDARNGYYRGTRFDWSGVIHSLKYKGHEFFGEWFDKHDPLIHDGITGPADVFDTNGTGLGYAEAKPGDNFIRIGVGLVEKPDEPAYRGTYTYKVADAGRRTVAQGKNWIEFGRKFPAIRVMLITIASASH